MMKKFSRFKEGAASFYIVAFSTLILVIVAASFATVIISAVTRTSNDDLSQSAYDAALAGVEDAKLAYSNYRRCVANGQTYADELDMTTNSVTCRDIVYWMNHEDCDMVGHMLGRIPKGSDVKENNEVAVSDTVYVDGENDATSDLNQAYTCVMIKTKLDDYRATLTASTGMRVVKVEFQTPASAAKVSRVRFSWYSNRADTTYKFSNMVESTSGVLSSSSGWRVAFQPTALQRVAAPPTMELQMVQTAGTFNLAQFDLADGVGTSNPRTNRATMFLTPTNQAEVANKSALKNYTGIWKGAANVLNAGQIAKTNNREISNVPFATLCADGTSSASTESKNMLSAEFACSAVLELPAPVGASAANPRSDETFMFVVTLPYGQPDTDFALEFLCDVGQKCSDEGTTVSVAGTEYPLAQVDGAQVVIDSTGRANDLYRRVEVRLESASTAFSYPEFALQLLGTGSGSSLAIDKAMTVTSEYGNYSRCNFSTGECD